MIDKEYLIDMGKYHYYQRAVTQVTDTPYDDKELTIRRLYEQLSETKAELTKAYTAIKRITECDADNWENSKAKEWLLNYEDKSE